MHFLLFLQNCEKHVKGVISTTFAPIFQFSGELNHLKHFFRRAKNEEKNEEEETYQGDVKIDNNTVQDCNVILFSRIETQCIKAVPANHGMRDAFSTGSQNQ